MENVSGIIGELIPIFGGILCVLYFGGYKEPKDPEKLKSLIETKEKHGKKLVILGYVLILFGVYNIIKHFVL